MKAILTVIGQDKVGIIAGVSQKMLEYSINILDVNQTIMQGFFYYDNGIRLQRYECDF
ncbi:putative amino acid-binding ACT domain protein [Clostridium beijerinckii]|nr:putative amino acid-binding ACT domain protein [Clostridium beijerinckii]